MQEIIKITSQNRGSYIGCEVEIACPSCSNPTFFDELHMGRVWETSEGWKGGPLEESSYLDNSGYDFESEHDLPPQRHCENCGTLFVLTKITIETMAKHVEDYAVNFLREKKRERNLPTTL